MEEEAFATRCGQDTGGSQIPGFVTEDILGGRDMGTALIHVDLEPVFRTLGHISGRHNGATVFPNGPLVAIPIDCT